MTKRFEMSMMGELKFFLGFQIKQLKDDTFISQTKYTNDMLKKFDMNNAKPIKTPMPSNGHLDLNEEGKNIVQKVYRSMIGSLLYLCASRPDIMLSVCMCARFQANCWGDSESSFCMPKNKSGHAKGSTAKPQKPRIPFPPSGCCVSAGTLRRQRSSQTNPA
jgi:hypothetical protein